MRTVVDVVLCSYLFLLAGAKATPPDLFIITEWMARGSLSSILLDPSQEISWQQRISWALGGSRFVFVLVFRFQLFFFPLKDIAKGIEYLHALRPKIIHRDLRSDNVMVDANNVAKITEFGLSRRKRFAMRASPRGVDSGECLFFFASPPISHLLTVKGS